MISEVYNEDCMIGMARYPDNYFDLAVVDPPYGIGVGSMPYTNGVAMVGKALAKRNNYKKDECWDTKRPDESYFNELIRVSKNQIIWGGNYFADLLKPSKGFIVWDKKIAEKYTNDFADCEIAYSSKGVARVFRFMWNGMLQGDMKNKETRIHPTQKPVALYSWIYHNYLPEGGKVIDTHLGSGSNRIAAAKAGNIDFYGWEIDKDYYEAQELRWRNYKSQLKLF